MARTSGTLISSTVIFSKATISRDAKLKSGLTLSLFSFTLTSVQKTQIVTFRRYCAYSAAAFCALCLLKLYPDEVEFKELPDADCCSTSWNRSPLRSRLQ